MTAIQESPVAWAVNHAHGTTFWDSEAKARRVADEWLASGVWIWAEVVPLYRSPTLTDAEREAIAACAAACENAAQYGIAEDARRASTLRALLERTTL